MRKAMWNKMEKLQTMFPEVWFKDGGEFDNTSADKLWSGEGSYIDGIPAFDYWERPSGLYTDFGIHKKLDAALDKLNLYAEFYDGGTVMIYPK
jgi:hypothetical protein